MAISSRFEEIEIFHSHSKALENYVWLIYFEMRNDKEQLHACKVGSFKKKIDPETKK
jgi:hypothetical protein